MQSKDEHQITRPNVENTLPEPPLIIVSLEGFTPSSLSCYGSSWNQTPTIDQLAASGCLWDRLIASDDQPVQLLAHWTQAQHDWVERCKQNGSIELITDRPFDNTDESCFDEITILPTEPVSERSSPAAECFETRFAQLIAAVVERLQSGESLGAIWLHSNFLAECWDAPVEPFESFAETSLAEHQEGEGGPIDDGPDAQLVNQIASSVKPAQFENVPNDHPDLVMLWMNRYGQQIQLIDLMIDYLLDEVTNDDPCLVLLGASGFRLGQGDFFGTQATNLRSADLQIPLLHTGSSPLRIPHLTSSDELPEILKRLVSEHEGHFPESRWSMRMSDAQPIQIQTNRSPYAVMTPDWWLVTDPDGSEHLYLKPDDGEDYNDVARLRMDVVDELLNLKKKPASDPDGA